MTTKAINKRLDALTEAKTSIPAIREILARRLADRPAAPSGAGDGYRLVLDHLYAEVLDLEQALQTAANALAEARGRFRNLKQGRDAARSDLGRRHRRLKRFLVGFFETRCLAQAGIARPVSKTSPELVHQIARTIRVLRDVDSLGPPILEVDFDAQAIAADLAADLGRLEAAIAGLETARAEVAAARGHVSATLAEVDRVAPWIGRCLESLCHLADEDLAQRLRRRR